MSKPRKTPESVLITARTAFNREIKVKLAVNDMTQAQLAERAGTTPPTVCRCLSDPDKITVERMRSLVTVLNPDPRVVLALLGYDAKTIRSLDCTG